MKRRQGQRAGRKFKKAANHSSREDVAIQKFLFGGGGGFIELSAKGITDESGLELGCVNAIEQKILKDNNRLKKRQTMGQM